MRMRTQALLVVLALSCTWLLDAPLAAQTGIHWSTMLGGSGDDFVEELVLLPDGGILVAGWTGSTDFPAPDPHGGGLDAFAVRMDADGALLWARRFGGPGNDRAFGADVALDGSGDILLGGYAEAGFPTTPGAFARDTDGGFVLRLAATDGALLWSTQIPGGRIRGLSADVDGTVLVAGVASATLPTTPGAFDESFNGGAADAFAARVSADGSALLWATFVGGTGTAAGDPPEVVEGALDARRAPGGEFVLVGPTDSSDFPVTAGAIQTSYGGGPADGFVTAVSADGSHLLWSTYLGGSDNDHLWRIAFGPDGSVYVGGESSSTDFPVTPGAFDTTLNDGLPSVTMGDAVIARLSADGGTLHWATYAGGSGNDHVHGLDIAADGSVYVGCSADSPDLPVTPGSFDQERNGGEDAWLFRLSANGSQLLYGSYLGGLFRSTVHALRVAPDGRVLVAGPTLSPDFPTTPDSFGPSPNGGWDGWVAAMDWSPCAGGFGVLPGGCPSALGLPQVLDGMGCPETDANFWIAVRHFTPVGSTLFLFLGAGTEVLPVKAGCSLGIGPLLPPLIVANLPPSGPGGASLMLYGTLPAGSPAVTVNLQALFADPAAPGGISGTQPLTMTIAP